MSVLKEVISSLIKSYENAVFVSDPVNVIFLQQQVRKHPGFKDQNSILLRFVLDDKIYSGIIQTATEDEARNALHEVPIKLCEKNAQVLNILKLPFNRIPLFPTFSVLDEIRGDVLKKINEKYWASFDNIVEALKDWYSRYIQYTKEIILEEIPTLGIALPYMVQGQSIYVLYNVTQKTIAAEYYGLGEKDSVIVEKTSEQIKSSEADKLFTQKFTLPPKEKHLRTVFSYGGESSPYSRWEHPYFAALKDLKEIVLKFNNQQPRRFYDAYTVSEAMIHYWTHKKIWRIRELAKKVPEFKKAFRSWLKGVQVLVVYFINAPKEGWVNDGTITSYYVNGPTDQIIVKRTYDKEESRFNEDKLKKYFPETSRKPFLGSRSSILHYLEDKVGV